MSVADAAERLQVTPRQVARLANRGELTVARTVGGVLLLDGASVHRRAQARPHRGRPLSAAAAWAALALLSDESVDWVDPPVLSRLRARLRRSSAEEVAWLVRRRMARVKRMQGWGDNTGLLATGTSVLADPYWGELFGLATVHRDDFEGYVAEDRVESTARDLGLIEAPRGEYYLRVVPTEARWPVDEIYTATVAVDLMESLDTREAAAGHRVLTQLLGQVS